MSEPQPQPVTVQAALSAVMGDVRSVGKRDRNESQNFNFRGIDAVVNAVGPALREHGVVVLPNVRDIKYGSVEVGRNRTQMAHVLVTVQYTFVGPAGDSMVAVSVGEAMDAGDKAVAKAMSVAFRICLLQALALPTTEPDPDASSYERSEALDLDKVKQEVWAAATAAKIIDPAQGDKAKADLSAAYFEQTGGDLGSASPEELHDWALALRAMPMLQNSLGVKSGAQQAAQPTETPVPEGAQA